MSSGQASIEFYNIATREISLVAEQAEHIEGTYAGVLLRVRGEGEPQYWDP